MGPIGCHKMLVTNYQSMLNNIPEQQRYQMCKILGFHRVKSHAVVSWLGNVYV